MVWCGLLTHSHIYTCIHTQEEGGGFHFEVTAMAEEPVHAAAVAAGGGKEQGGAGGKRVRMG